ncbi:hypothetical protein Q3G72_013819 [Acer saccharum]|nr:hypothetical protein Q3G72_013819 [Acer saccharum]
MLVDVTAGHELLSFMDAYFGYNKILMHPDDQEKTAFVTERVSDTAVSVVLVREENNNQHPVYYISKALLDAETMYSRLEKLALALVVTARKLRPYFQCHSIKAYQYNNQLPIQGTLASREPPMHDYPSPPDSRQDFLLGYPSHPDSNQDFMPFTRTS